MTRRTLFRRTLIALGVLLMIFALSATFADAQDGDGPRTVTDAVGRTVTLEGPPQRIVGMSASISEMLFAIGVTPVGVTDGMDYPPAAATLPTFGSGYQPDLEKLAALEPDLIVANAQMQMPFLDKLEAIAPVIVVVNLVAADVPRNIELLGQITWHETSATMLAQTYDRYLAMAAELGRLHPENPTYIFIVGTLDFTNYGKSETYMGDMARMLGATNLADGLEDAGPFPGYAQLSIEAILDADPDYIFTVTRGADVPMNETMAADPIWSSLTAVQEGRAIELDNRLFVEAPGPRFVEALAQLYQILYGAEN